MRRTLRYGILLALCMLLLALLAGTSLAAERPEPKSCIDDSFCEERESFSAAGRSQLLKSNGKTAKDNKEKALKALLDSKRNG